MASKSTSKKFRFRVIGARGAVYETTTYAEAKRLAGKRGVIERIGDKKRDIWDDFYFSGGIFYGRDESIFHDWTIYETEDGGWRVHQPGPDGRMGPELSEYSTLQKAANAVGKRVVGSHHPGYLTLKATEKRYADAGYGQRQSNPHCVSNPSKKNSLTVNSIRSKKGPTYKLQISGSVNGVEVNGETAPVYIGLDEVTPRLSRDISLGRVFRSDGSGKKLTTAMNMAVEKAVYKELERLDKQRQSNPHLADTYSKVHAILTREGGAAGLKALKSAFPPRATNIDKALPPHHKVPGVVRHGDGDYLKVKPGYEKDVTRYTNPSLPSGMSRELRSLPVGKTLTLNGKRVRRLDNDHWAVEGTRYKLANATVAVMGG